MEEDGPAPPTRGSSAGAEGGKRSVVDVLGVRCGGVRAAGAGAGTLVLGSPLGTHHTLPSKCPRQTSPAVRGTYKPRDLLAAGQATDGVTEQVLTLTLTPEP